MKKIISLLLVAIMAIALVACTNNNEDTTKTDADATQTLSAIWADLAEDEKYFVSGGDMVNNTVENDAGKVEDANFMTYNMLLPEELHSQVDDVASLIHGMNANSLTLGMYHLTEGTDEAEFAETMRSAIQGNRWMCGFPEQLFIASVDGFVLVGYGLTDNIESIKTHLASVYPNSTIICEEAIA